MTKRADFVDGLARKVRELVDSETLTYTKDEYDGLDITKEVLSDVLSNVRIRLEELEEEEY